MTNAKSALPTKGPIYETREPQIHNEGLWADHDMPCAVCHVHPAVMDCQSQVFAPCWECQIEGWGIKKKWLWPWQRKPIEGRMKLGDDL